MLEISLNRSCSRKFWYARMGQVTARCGPSMGILTAPASYLLSQGRLVPTRNAHSSPRVRVLEEEGSERLWERFLGELRESVSGWGRVLGLTHHTFLLSPSGGGPPPPPPPAAPSTWSVQNGPAPEEMEQQRRWGQPLGGEPYQHQSSRIFQNPCLPESRTLQRSVSRMFLLLPGG